MSFTTDLTRFQVTLRYRVGAVFVGTVKQAENSIVYGSALTGAPGQPVDTKELRGSWKKRFVTDNRVEIFTESPYARPNEDGIARPGGGPYRQLSPVGGRWSVRKTSANIQRLVDYVTKLLKNKRR